MEGTAWARGSFERWLRARLPRAQIVSGYCIHMRIETIFQNGTNSLDKSYLYDAGQKSLGHLSYY